MHHHCFEWVNISLTLFTLYTSSYATPKAVTISLRSPPTPIPTCMLIPHQYWMPTWCLVDELLLQQWVACVHCLRRRNSWNKACSFIPINISWNRRNGTYLGWPPGETADKYSIGTTYKDEIMSFIPVNIYLLGNGVLTWITPGDTVTLDYARGVVDTPLHLTPCGGNHTESVWPLINKESHCYFHMHVFACADYVTDNPHIVASLQLRDTAPQLELLS